MCILHLGATSLNGYCEQRTVCPKSAYDDQGRPLSQRELYERHAEWLKANRTAVHDLRIGEQRET
jgi:hypothetical protein